MKITNILVGALLLTGSAFASTIVTDYGTGGVLVTLGTQSASSERFGVFTKIGEARSEATKEDNGYEWLMSWNVDPTLSWSFTTITNGFQTIDFFIPVIGGPFDRIFSSGGYAITGTKTSSGAGITGFKIEALVGYNGGAGPIQPKGLVTVPDTTGVNGSLSMSDDNTNNGGVGPFVAFGPQAATDMGVRVSFTAILEPGDQLGLNGTLTIEQLVPEPATFGLFGAALLALGALARRRA
jgi:hypothetical protein